MLSSVALYLLRTTGLGEPALSYVRESAVQAASQSFDISMHFLVNFCYFCTSPKMKHMTNIISCDRICMGHFRKRGHVRTSRGTRRHSEDKTKLRWIIKEWLGQTSCKDNWVQQELGAAIVGHCLSSHVGLCLSFPFSCFLHTGFLYTISITQSGHLEWQAWSLEFPWCGFLFSFSN